MGLVLTDPPFERWVQHVFDHPVAKPEWYWDLDADRADVRADLVVSHLTRLFEESEERLAAYTDAQVNQGLWFLCSASDALFALRDTNVALDERVSCIRSISTLYVQLFARRCTSHLSHLDDAGASALNSICYMWWDIVPLHGEPKNTALRRIDAACLDVLEEIIGLASIACQESALHGLGHWALYYPKRCADTVNEFIASHPRLRPELLAYAECAREGMVQ